MSPDIALFYRSSLFNPDNLTVEQKIRRQEYVQKMLDEIDQILLARLDDSRAIFILFYGLNSDYGKWTAQRIAYYFGIQPDEVIRIVQETASALPSPDHQTFARDYFDFF